jgi:dephospho-CoA kinase
VLNIALTGNIAAGKSTVADLFRRWGATVISADELAKDAQQPGTEVLTTIVKRFGTNVLLPDGSLDRAALRAKVMGDDEALRALNAIVHPAVRQRRARFLTEARARGDVLLVNEIPLLFEAMDPAQFDAVVLVDAPVALRRERLLEHRALSADEADRMIRVQMPAERKRPRSHHVIENSGSRSALERAARVVFDELRRRAARGELAWSSVVLVTSGSGDCGPMLQALTRRLRDAGIPMHRVSAGRATLGKLLLAEARSGDAPAILVTPTARAVATAAWEQAGRPGRFYAVIVEGRGNDVPLDLRPWGGARVALRG